MLFWQTETTAEAGEKFCRLYDEFLPVHRAVFEVKSNKDFYSRQEKAKAKWREVVEALSELQIGLNSVDTLLQTQRWDTHCECGYMSECRRHVELVLDEYKRGARFRVDPPEDIPDSFHEAFPNTQGYLDELEGRVFLNRASARNCISEVACKCNAGYMTDRLRSELGSSPCNVGKFSVVELPKFRVVCNLVGGGTDAAGEEFYDTEEEAHASIKDFVTSWNDDIPEHNPEGEPYSLDDFGVEPVTQGN